MKKLVVAFYMLLWAVPATPQQVTGSITGSVADSSGAAIPGVTVRLSNPVTGIHRSTSSDQDGNFRFLVVPPGNYAIDASQQGFKGVRRDGITVEADRSLSVPLVLEVGAVTEIVEVFGGTPLLEPNTRSEERRVGKECRL